MPLDAPVMTTVVPSRSAIAPSLSHLQDRGAGVHHRPGLPPGTWRPRTVHHGCPWERISPGVGRVTLRIPVPSQSEGDGLASDLTHPLSLSDASTAWVANRPGYPNLVQPVRHNGSHRSA